MAENKNDTRLYDTVIFDLDGTLLNTLEDLKDGINHMLALYNYPERSLEEIRNFVGNGIYRLVEQAVPEGLTKEKIQQFFLEYREYYTNHCKNKTRPYEGILELLEELKKQGYKLAIVSNKSNQAVQELVVEYFPDLMDVAMGEKEGIQKKPAPDMVNEVIRLLHTDHGRTLYVGDSEVDKLTAENAGLAYVLVDWGFRHREELMELKPEKIISKPEELLDCFVYH